MDEIMHGNYLQLALIKRISFCLPFTYRLNILQKLITDQQKLNEFAYQITIRRDNIFEDGFNSFKKIAEVNLKAIIQVFYVDSFGMIEKGIDGGGIFKEFLNDITKIVFNPDYGLFKLTKTEQQLYPNPEAEFLYFNIYKLLRQYLGKDYLKIFHFIGVLVGRAIYDNVLIDTVFSPFFLRKMLGKQNFLNELQNMDLELYNNLKFLKTYEGNVSDLALVFTATSSNGKEIELLPNGKNIEVNNDNKFKYIYLMANYKLNEEIKAQCNSFLQGISRVISSDFLKLFNEYELQRVIGGDNNCLNIQDMKDNAQFVGYKKNDSYINKLWEIIAKMEQKDQRLFIKFITSCERPPLLGFSNLSPKLTICKINSEGDQKLPTANTCFNKLNLPYYSNTKLLENKLLQSIRLSSGFYLT